MICRRILDYYQFPEYQENKQKIWEQIAQHKKLNNHANN